MVIASNFRPISVVLVIAKLLEKIVSIQFSRYLQQNKLLHPHQGAFRCGKSTEDILLLAVDHIITFLDKEKAVCAAFLDLRKLTSVLSWFQNYLSGRVHRVKCCHESSEWRKMRGGIPQKCFGAVVIPHTV